MRQFEIRRHDGGRLRAIFTADVEPNRLSPDALIIRLALEQLVFDGSHQVRIYDVGADDEIRGIHFEHLTLRFSMDILFSVTGSSETARREEVVQIIGRYGGEIDESGKRYHLWKPSLLMAGAIHTSVSSCRNKDTVLLGTVIWHRCRMEDDRKKELAGEISSEQGSPWSLRCIP